MGGVGWEGGACVRVRVGEVSGQQGETEAPPPLTFRPPAPHHPPTPFHPATHLVSRTMNTKSVMAGEYTAPPAQGPMMTDSCGM